MEEILHHLIGGLSHYFRVLTIPLVVQDCTSTACWLLTTHLLIGMQPQVPSGHPGIGQLV